MKFVGHDGEIELVGNVINIKKGKKDAGRTIPLADIVSTTLIKPVLTASGCIHIQVLGAKTYPSVANVMHYATDMNAICFRKAKFNEAIAFKETLDSALAGAHAPVQSQSPDVDRLRQLKQLLDEGIITQDDFDKKKAEILGL